MRASKTYRRLSLVLCLVTIVACHTESEPMNHVDEDLKSALDQAGDKSVAVLIGCGDDCEAVMRSLESAGVRVSQEESIAFGIISAEITAEQLETVIDLPSVTFIEEDKEASAF